MEKPYKFPANGELEFSPDVAQTILKKWNENNWDLYLVIDKEDDEKTVTRGPTTKIDLRELYGLFPKFSPLSLYNSVRRHMKENNLYASLSFDVPVTMIHGDPESAVIDETDRGVYQAFNKRGKLAKDFTMPVQCLIPQERRIIHINGSMEYILPYEAFMEASGVPQAHVNPIDVKRFGYLR